jgi:hypothetical protein
MNAIKDHGMAYPSTKDPAFLARTARWLAERHEVLALIRYSRAAGAKDFEFFDSVEAFQARLRDLPPQTCVTVFGERQLPLRGRVNDDFIQQALALIPDGTEFALVGLERVRHGESAWYPMTAGETSVELCEELREWCGRLVAVGPYPPWLADGDEVVSAVVPSPNGSVTTGVY